MTKTRDYRDHLDEVLVDPEASVAYLQAALEDGSVDVFLLALRDVAKARGGSFAALARNAKVNRENLFRILSDDGNPTIRNLTKILDELGLRLSVEPKDGGVPATAR